MDMNQLFGQLWDQYTELAPSALKVRQLFEAKGEEVLNDHIAFRTFNHPKVNIGQLAKPFLELGYVAKGEYDFPAKKLYARHFEHATDANAPKIFISELKLEECSQLVRETANRLVSEISEEQLQNPVLCTAGRLWNQPSHDLYQVLRSESEYAAWLYVYGFCANHFTVNVNALKHFASLEEVNAFLKENGFKMNASGGEIKGTPGQLLQQSSTLADMRSVIFTDGQYQVPSCYYEFALRYNQPNGELYSGFIAASADKIFESTDLKHQLA